MKINFMDYLAKCGLIGCALLLPSVVMAAQSAPGASEARFYNCSYTIRPDSFWTAVETRLPYDGLVEQWKAYAKAKGGSSAYCFSRYRKDDAPYGSLEEVEAIGRLSAGAKRVDWAPRQSRGQAAAGRADKDSGAIRAATGAVAIRTAKEVEFQAKLKKFQEDLAEQQAAVAKYRSDLAQVEAEKAARASAAKAAQDEAARKQSAYEAEAERVRKLHSEYEATVRAATPNVRK